MNYRWVIEGTRVVEMKFNGESVLFSKIFLFSLILFESLEILLARNIPFRISNEISHDATP